VSDNSTRKPRPRKDAGKPKKPYPEFPLSPHPSGYWQKKIRGKIHYFGKWAKRVSGKLVRIEGDGWKEALELYKVQADDLHAGRTPRVKTDGLTVADLCNQFLTAKLHQREARELSLRSFGDYKAATDRIVAAFGKTRLVDDLAAADFEALRATMAKTWGPVRLGAEIQKVRTVFKYGYEAGIIDKPIRFGPQFVKPSFSVLRRHRAQSGEKMLEAKELRQLIDAAGMPMKAMSLLAINCGFGNTDCSSLPLSALDLDAGWIDFPRPKTGIPRRCPLWPETVSALREALAMRPAAKNQADAGLVFLSQRGTPLVRIREGTPPNDETEPNKAKAVNRTDGVAVQFSSLLKRLALHRNGVGFYTLRHVFRTVADAARDPVAIDLIMGHADPSMGGHYRERIDDSRLKAVTDHVHAWLFTETPDDGPTDTAPKVGDQSVPCEPEATESESEEAQESLKIAPMPPADERPMLRLYVG
jgi:integrase